MKKLPLLLVASLLMVGCAGPDDQQIEQEFRSRHPGCDLLSTETGEGDSDNVYVTFRMRCPDGDETSTQALFQKVDGEWVIKWEMPVMTQPI
jgi:hypothetical protein